MKFTLSLYRFNAAKIVINIITIQYFLLKIVKLFAFFKMPCYLCPAFSEALNLIEPLWN